MAYSCSAPSPNALAAAVIPACAKTPSPVAATPPDTAPTAAEMPTLAQSTLPVDVYESIAVVTALTTAPTTAPTTIFQNSPSESSRLTGLLLQ